LIFHEVTDKNKLAPLFMVHGVDVYSVKTMNTKQSVKYQSMCWHISKTTW